MANYHNDIADIDLENGTVMRSFANHVICEGDSEANRFGVRIRRNGVPVDIGGATCIGYFIRANGETVVINGGSFNGQEAFVSLPDSCYTVIGNFTLVIKLVGAGVTGTMRIIDGTVVDSINGTPIDPGSQVPDLSELMAVIQRAENAAETIADLSIEAVLIEGENYAITITHS